MHSPVPGRQVSATPRIFSLFISCVIFISFPVSYRFHVFHVLIFSGLPRFALSSATFKTVPGNTIGELFKHLGNFELNTYSSFLLYISNYFLSFFEDAVRLWINNLYTTPSLPFFPRKFVQLNEINEKIMSLYTFPSPFVFLWWVCATECSHPRSF